MPWQIGPNVETSTGAPVVTLQELHFTIEKIAFAGQFWYMYENSNSHPIAPGNLKGWGRGAKIEDPEWTHATGERYRACFTRRNPISMVVKLRANGIPSNLPSVHLRMSPQLDGKQRHLKPASSQLLLRNRDAWAWVETQGALPNEIGRYILELRWEVRSQDGRTYQIKPEHTKHHIYGIYGHPKKPNYDSSNDNDSGEKVPKAKGTLTGTKKRFDHLMSLVGGSDKRASVETQADVDELFWRLHTGINDTPGDPPYFDAGHDEHLTEDGNSDGTEIEVKHQWLAWLDSPSTGAQDPADRHWNDLSCAGHVQLFKTMIAAVGLFARRTWIFPHTKKLPDGSTTSFSDRDLYSLGYYEDRSTLIPKPKVQETTIKYLGVDRKAKCVLIEPDGLWENFEACVRAPNGRFMPGGYTLGSLPRSAVNAEGFGSAAELIQWWGDTVRTRWDGQNLNQPFRRFLAWVSYDRSNKSLHYFDVEGNHYTRANFEQIRKRGKDLPPPTP